MAAPDLGKSARVRELCRLLKPVIGNQADRIWMAFLVEDQAGKAQLQDYLEVLAAQRLHNSLESNGPGLVPPRREDAAGEFTLGAVTYNGREFYPFGLRDSEWTQHVGVYGRSGAGKTNFGFLIVQQLINAGKPVLILDWKRNYRDLVALPGFENMAVYTIGRAVAPFRFNPLIPPTGTAPQTWIKKLIAVIAHSYLLGDGVMYLLQEALDQAYAAAGVYDGSVDRWPTFRDVLELLRKRQASGREAGWMSSALRAFASLCFGEMDTLVNQGHDRVEDLLTRPVVLELDALTQSDKVFVAQAILLWIHHFRMTEPVRETFKNAIVIEEAHHILAGERHSLVGGQSVMEIAFREIREFGTSIILLDQMPSTIAPSALANTYAVVSFNLKHRADVTAISQAMLLDDSARDVLGNLQVGQAVVRLQGRAVGPFTINVPEFVIEKGAFTDVRVQHHMSALGLLSTRSSRGDSAAAATQTRVGNGALAQEGAVSPDDAPGLKFLSDVASFPESGIADRYRRLGLSVRRGEQLKADLVQRRLILEELQTTSRGKRRMIRLTEQGTTAIIASDRL